MFRTAFFACLILVLASGRPVASQDGTAIIERDIRLFVFNAALNVAGFDVELAPQYHPVRQLLRDSFTDLDPDLVRRLQLFYRDYQRTQAGREAALAPFVSLALNVTPPPDIAPLYDDSRIPLDARDVMGFIPLVREFYATADVEQLWELLRPVYQEAMGRLSVPVRASLFSAEAYLRESRAATAVRQVVILLELSSPVNSVHVRNYPDNLYVVLGDSGTAPLAEIRHGYLHLLLDPLIADHREVLANASDLLSWIKGVEGVRADYTSDLELMAVESLIRAVELRMDVEGEDYSGQEADLAYREGLLLVPYFLEGLRVFETRAEGIRLFLPSLIEDLDVTVERARFEGRFFDIAMVDVAPVRGVVPLAADPVREVLREAQQAFNGGDDETAAALFSQVITEMDPESGEAFYGMALIASRDQDPDRAREYFSLTIESENAPDAMVAWSHVYMGRIDDIDCDRPGALEHYSNVLDIAGQTPTAAIDAALEAIEMPFGGGC